VPCYVSRCAQGATPHTRPDHDDGFAQILAPDPPGFQPVAGSVRSRARDNFDFGAGPGSACGRVEGWKLMTAIRLKASPALFALWALAPVTADAADPAGIYVGTALGSEQGHPAWQAMLGARPSEFFGLELAYTDFGKASAAGPPQFIFGYYDNSLNQHAATLFAVGYLPRVARHMELFGKLGLARLHSDSRITSQPPHCPAGVFCIPFTTQQDSWSTDFAYGAGIQAHLGSLAARAEFVQLRASPVNPHMFSVGVTRTF
jgi:hypothetical protein